MPPFARTRSDGDSFMEELRGFPTACRDCCARQAPRAQYCNSMVGQVSPLDRQSIAPMALQVEGGSVWAMPRLVSAARWDAEAMRETSQPLVQDERSAPAGVLSVEETGCGKNGADAVGVARPYCGALGTVEHCQVGVGAA